LIVDDNPKFTPPAILTLLNPNVPFTEPVPIKVNVPALAPVAREPLVALKAPPLETVIVFPPPTVNTPVVSDSVPSKDTLLASVTPAALLISRLFAPEKPVPVDCALLPLNV
jgi:hypothetical protein